MGLSRIISSGLDPWRVRLVSGVLRIGLHEGAPCPCNTRTSPAYPY